MSAGREDDILCLDFFLPTCSQFDVNFASANEFGGTFDDFDLVLLHQETDALCQTRADLAAAFVGGGVIQFEIIKTKAVFFCAGTQGVSDLGVMKQGLGGDAAHVQTNTAQPLFFNDRGFQTQLGRANGGDITTRTSSNDNNIKFFHFHS